MSRLSDEAKYLRNEHHLASRVRANKEADLAGKCGRPGREVRAEAVRSLCLDRSNNFDRVVVHNGVIIGRLQLEDNHIKKRLSFRNCEFPKGISLFQARADGPIEFINCDIADIDASRLESRSDIVLRNCTTRASFVGAQIGDGTIVGDLIFTGSRLHQFGQVALDARDLLVTGSLLLDRNFHADGKVLLESASIGHDLDCRGGHFDNPGHCSIEATHLAVSGELICERGFTSHGEILMSWAQARTIRFRGACLTNPGKVALRADGVTVTNGVHLGPEFHATGSIHLVGAHIGGELACTDGRFDNGAGNAIEAERLTAADVYLDRGFHSTGSVRLVGAQLDRQLTCTGGRFDNPGGYALDAAGLVCGGGVFLDAWQPQNTGFTSQGEVHLTGATIGTELTCTGAFLNCPSGIALNADGLTTNGNVNLDGDFRAVGEVRLARANVGRQLRCTGASLDGPGELALDLSGAIVNGDIELSDGFHSVGEVRLTGAQVVRNVNFTEARLTRIGGPALAAHKLRAGSSIMWLPAETPNGSIDFSFADTNTLTDAIKSWPRIPDRDKGRGENNVVLEGFTFRTLDSDIPLEDRLNVLRHTNIYSMQQYRELATAYRIAGEHKNYRLTMIDGFRNERRRGDLSRYSRVSNWFLEWTVGFGYRLWLPFVYVAVLGFVMGFVYHYAEHHPPTSSGKPAVQPHMVPVQREIHPANGCSKDIPVPSTEPTPKPSATRFTAPTPCPPDVVPQLNADFVNGRLGGDYPSFNAWTYSYGLLIPVANLQQISYWLPDGHGAFGKFLLYYTWIAVTLGWLLAIALVAGVGNLIKARRE